jgi:bifunctional non-homologous end joining protein LigD
MSRVVKGSASRAVKSGPSRQGVALPPFVPPQLSQSVEKPPSGPQWMHEIKLDGYRMAARIDNGHAQLLTRTGLDWTGKFPSIIAALTNVTVKTAYFDGELCGIDKPRITELCPYSGGDRRRERCAAHLLRLRSLAP